MKKQVVNEFAKVREALNTYETEVGFVLKVYRENIAAAKKEAPLFKDPAGRIAQVKQELVPPARARIAAADQSLAQTARGVAKVLREVLSQRVAERPDGEFVALLKVYGDLGVKLSASEMRMLLPSAQGNYLAPKALAAVAERSGYRLTTPSLDKFEEDVRDIERLTRFPLLFVPKGYEPEGVDVLADVPRFSPDGRWIHSQGRPTAGIVATHSNYLRSLEKRIDEAAGRWATDFVPALEELTPIKLTNGETLLSEEDQRDQAVKRAADAIELDEREAVHVAEKLKEINEEAAQKASEIRAKFVGR